jgi:hypothetical protein
MAVYEVLVSYAYRRKGDVFQVEADDFSSYLMRQGYVRELSPDAEITLDRVDAFLADPSTGRPRKRRARREKEVTDDVEDQAVPGGGVPDSES